MKSLAIFGDSYGKSGGHVLGEKSWVDFINDTKQYDVTNFSEGGSTLWYSYKLFLDHNHKFDKVIFLVTSPHRLELAGKNVQLFAFQNYYIAKLKVNTTQGELRKQYQTIIDYYELIHNHEKEECLHRLMVESLCYIRKDVIVYPCFSQPYMKDKGLFEITQFEDKIIGLTESVREELYRKLLRDDRSCHMTEDNNKIVSQMFLDRLENKDSSLNLDNLVKPIHSYEYYYCNSWPENLTKSEEALLRTI
jgi:hypothetical protein